MASVIQCLGVIQCLYYPQLLAVYLMHVGGGGVGEGIHVGCREQLSFGKQFCPPTSLEAVFLILRCTGPCCSKLTTSLVKVWLKFQTLISDKFRNFSTKNVCVFGNKVIKY